MNWEEIKEKESGTILHDEFDGGVRFIVMRGPCSLCAYVGIPSEHPLAGFDSDELTIDCHGGLTFAGEGDGENDKHRPKGFYWYGWDYGHLHDYVFFYDKEPNLAGLDDKKWLVEDVIKDSWGAIYDFKALMKLAEKIKGK